MITPMSHRFYEPCDGSNYYVTELQWILGLSRSSIYRLIRKHQIEVSKSSIGRKVTTVHRFELLKLLGTSTFKGYINRLETVEATPHHDTQCITERNSIPLRRLKLMYVTPADFSKKNKLKLADVLMAIRVGLIPTIIINNTIFISPAFKDTGKGDQT